MITALASTLDQAQALLAFSDTIAKETLFSTIVLTAARGQGKGGALRSAMAAGLAHGYAKVFVTNPSPENLKTLFEYVLKGLDALG